MVRMLPAFLFGLRGIGPGSACSMGMEVKHLPRGWAHSRCMRLGQVKVWWSDHTACGPWRL